MVEMKGKRKKQAYKEKANNNIRKKKDSKK